MSAEIGAACLKEFLLKLEEIDAALALLKAAAKLRPRLGGYINWSYADEEGRALIQSFLGQKVEEFSVLFRGAVVSISGGFEHFVRRLLVDAVSATNLSHKTFLSLPDNVRSNNIYWTGRALTAVRDPLDHLVIDPRELAVNLASCFGGSDDYKLNSDAFSYFVTRVTPKHLEDLFGSINVAFDWDDFGRKKEMESLFGTSGARETGKKVSAQLGEFIKLRNRIAHSGADEVAITDDDIARFIGFFRHFATEMVAIVSSRLRKLGGK